jgi:hypothetical protein
MTIRETPRNGVPVRNLCRQREVNLRTAVAAPQSGRRHAVATTYRIGSYHPEGDMRGRWRSLWANAGRRGVFAQLSIYVEPINGSCLPARPATPRPVRVSNCFAYHPAGDKGFCCKCFRPNRKTQPTASEAPVYWVAAEAAGRQTDGSARVGERRAGRGEAGIELALAGGVAETRLPLAADAMAGPTGPRAGATWFGGGRTGWPGGGVGAYRRGPVCTGDGQSRIRRCRR